MISRLIVMILVVGCSRGPIVLPAPALTASENRSSTQLPAPPAAASPSSTPRPSPTPIPQCEQHVPSPPQYDLEATLDYTGHTLDVEQTVSLINWTGEWLSELVFGVNANLRAGVLELQSAAVDDRVPPFQLAGSWLHMTLDPPLAPGCHTQATFRYRLNLPPLDPFAWGWRGTLGWNGRQTLLGEWYPFLAGYRPGAGWLSEPVSRVGEYQTSESSTFNLRLSVENLEEPTLLASAQAVPCPEAPAAPGQMDWTACYELAGTRFFALAVSDVMLTETQTAADAVITSAYFSDHEQAGQAALQVAAGAFQTYSVLFGPVPYRSLTVVETDLVDGMEYSGLFYLSAGYYAAYDDTPQNYLTVIAAHESAHQWFYSLVGNNPAQEPWLDESLATYAELLYLEAHHPELVEWWWDFRVRAYAPEGQVDASVYDFIGPRPYINAVYLRGAQLWQSAREQVGDETFFELLREYIQNGSGKVVQGNALRSQFARVGVTIPPDLLGP